ncbi:MAG: hypothetical protein A2W19_02585 [Spirochaetes bacterium RBG_16_49_21]|nr:MAG: hypothetical protein A2W19_02585 [Spirochaetes bacterium RBG_16_49_21]
MLLKRIILLLLPVGLLLFMPGISAEKINKQNEKVSPADNPNNESKNIFGFGILSRISGLWNGPVSSATPAGSFDKWYVDFRPVSPGQVSQYSTLDKDTLNYISLFIVKHNNRLKVAMRTEGVFQNKGCVTYEAVDTVRESEGYYRFSDFQTGAKRAYTEFFFKDDEFIMEVYTSKFNKVYPLQLHSRWKAKLGDRKSASGAVSHFKFPRPVMIKDFSNVFKNMSESIYFSFENDPYSSATQPYVGNVTVNIIVDDDIKVKNNHELFLLLTTESLFEGLKYKKENLKYISKYAYLPINTKSYTFNNVHPGKYYLYSYIDINSDKKHLSGDYMSSDLNTIFLLKEKGNIIVNTKIDFLIP